MWTCEGHTGSVQNLRHLEIVSKKIPLRTCELSKRNFKGSQNLTFQKYITQNYEENRLTWFGPMDCLGLIITIGAKL